MRVRETPSPSMGVRKRRCRSLRATAISEAPARSLTGGREYSPAVTDERESSPRTQEARAHVASRASTAAVAGFLKGFLFPAVTISAVGCALRTPTRGFVGSTGSTIGPRHPPSRLSGFVGPVADRGAPDGSCQESDRCREHDCHDERRCPPHHEFSPDRSTTDGRPFSGKVQGLFRRPIRPAAGR
jgi:hypothetical protein